MRTLWLRFLERRASEFPHARPNPGGTRIQDVAAISREQGSWPGYLVRKNNSASLRNVSNCKRHVLCNAS